MENFSVLAPYRTSHMNEFEYSYFLRSLIKIVTKRGIKFVDFCESTLYKEDESDEKVYVIKFFGDPELVKDLFDHEMKGYYGERLLFVG